MEVLVYTLTVIFITVNDLFYNILFQTVQRLTGQIQNFRFLIFNLAQINKSTNTIEVLMSKPFLAQLQNLRSSFNVDEVTSSSFYGNKVIEIIKEAHMALKEVLNTNINVVNQKCKI